MTKDSKDGLTWKWRIFWTEYSHERNELADFSFLKMPFNRRKREEHYDIYYYLPGTLLNIKMREDALIIKEMKDKKGDLCGFARRKIFYFPIAAASLPIAMPFSDVRFNSGEELLEAFSRYYPGFKIYCMDKKRTSATFVSPKDETKRLKAEFSELRFEDKIFQTLCLESKNRKWLKTLTERPDMNDGIVSDYYRLLALL